MALVAGVVLNPQRIGAWAGWLSPKIGMPVSPDLFRVILLVVIFAAMFVWFHKQRMAFEENQAPHPTVALFEALRYVARDSVWASHQEADPKEDERWALRHREEVIRQLTLGRLRTWGRQIGPERLHGASGIGASFWGRADHFDPFDIMMDNSAEHAVRAATGIAFADIRFLRSELEYVWPHRPIWDALLRRSPVERTGLDKVWKRRDLIMDAAAKRLHVRREKRAI